MTDQKLQTLKNEIDTSKNEKLELQEIEDFLKSSDNINKLWHAMEQDCSPELLQEFESAIWELCGNIIETKDKNSVTYNQLDILYFYIQYFWKQKNENRIIKKRYKKVWSLLKILWKSYKKRCKKYNIQPKIVGIQHLDPIDPSIPSNNVYEYLRIKGDEYIKMVEDFQDDMSNELERWFNDENERMIRDVNDNLNEGYQKIEEDFYNKTDTRRIVAENVKPYLDKRESEKADINNILIKTDKLSANEKKQLIDFRNYYYELWHKTYTNDEITKDNNYNKLKEELWRNEIWFQIYWYDNIANRIDWRIEFDNFDINNVRNIKTIEQINNRINKFSYYYPKEANSLTKKIKNKINEISEKKFNNWEIPTLSSLEIWRFQLEINQKYWEKLKIDGKMDTQNLDTTTTYIYREWLCSKYNKKFYIENLGTTLLLFDLGEKWKGNKIIKEFFTYYFSIKNKYKKYRNNIPSEFFQSFIALIINREAWDNTAKSAIDKMKKDFENALKNQQKIEEENKRIMQEKAKIEKEEKIVKAFNKEVNNVIKLLNNNPQEKDKFKPVANAFIKLYYNNDYKPYKDKLKSLASQVFIEIYCLWDNESERIRTFWINVNNECKKYRELLKTYSKKEEEALDYLDQVEWLNEEIKKWNVRTEKHYDQTETYRYSIEYPDAIDQTMVNRYGRNYNGRENNLVKFSDKIPRNATIHVDEYHWTGYLEKYHTAIKVEYIDERGKKHTDILYSKSYKPNERIHQPNPHGRYAILPDNLKQKANTWKIKLGVITDPTTWQEIACIYEYNGYGDNITIHKINKQGKIYKTETIDYETYNQAIINANNRNKIREAEEYKAKFDKIEEDFSKLIENNNAVQKLIQEFQNWDLDWNEYKQLISFSSNLYEMTKAFYDQRDKIFELKISLEGLTTNSNNYINSYEAKREAYLGFITEFENFATIDNVNKARDLMNQCLNEWQIHENDNRYDKTRQERTVLVASFVAAIAATCVALWTFGLASPLAAGWRTSFLAALAVWTISTWASMYVSELSQQLLNAFSSWSINIDWKTYELTYDNPTLLQQAMDPNSDVTFRDALKWYGTQFATGTLLQWVFMFWWGYVSNLISKSLAKAQPGSFLYKSKNIICKVFTREDIKDPYTQWLLRSTEEQVSKPWFRGNFRKELLEESWEEAVENWADEISPILWVVAQIYNCIKPHPWMALETAKVSNPELSISTSENKVLALSTYDWTPESKKTLMNYYGGLPGYNIIEQEWGVLRVTTNNIKEEWLNGSVELLLQPSKIDLSIRNINPAIRQKAWININHDTWEFSYDPEKLAKFWEELQKQNWWLVQFNQDWTATLIIWNETIPLKNNENQVTPNQSSSDQYNSQTNQQVEVPHESSTNTYFSWKSHRFDVTESQTRWNSNRMDKLLNDINEQNKSEKLNELRKLISEQYNQATWADLQLTDEQLLSILDAHEQDWILWELTTWQLRQKVKILSETISDKNIRRFLLEAWFCGKLWIDHIWDIAKMNHQNITELIEGKSKLKISEMTVNDLGMLMRKAANMWLDTTTIWTVKEIINERIEIIKKWTYNKEDMSILENNIAEISFEIEIRSIEINDSNFETKIDEIKKRINEKFWESSKIWKELTTEVTKKEFEFYKTSWDINRARLTITKMEILNNELLSEDITNFRYKRWLLDVELYKIQLWTGNINRMNKAAEELREDTETIWWRTDINTLLSKIEAWILLWKPQSELDAYLSFLAIQENDAWVNVLWDIISTISNTFPSQELEDSAKRIEDAWKASNNADLKQKWDRAREIAENYKKMKQDLEWDKNGVEKKKLQDKINEFVYEKPINTITDIWNTFTHPLKLFNYWSVASIEISENTYSKTREILTWERTINGVKMWENIDMDGNRDPTQKGFNKYMQTINQEFDTFIRTLYSTEKLQELNSAHHSAVYDANMKSYLEKVWLNDLAQVIEIYWIADCRVHAFTKQIFFDTLKRTQLQNLQKKLNSETDPAKRKTIEKQIKILKNTKMVYVDSTLTWNVRMKAKYQAEKWENGNLVRWNENAIIEEHTYNLIEIPTISDDWTITWRNVYYADSFYQGIKEDGNNTGKVYDLSFNPNTPITTIYGRSYYTKKNWKYVHDPKVNMYMTTEVIWSDWNVIPITTVPLFRSVQWRGETLKPSNIQTEVLTEQEVKDRNEKTRANVEAIDKIIEKRTNIIPQLKEAIKDGDIGKLKEILENWIESDIYYDETKWERIKEKWKVKISETQAKFLQRAIEICEGYNWDIPTNMQQALNTMLESIVTQDEVNYRLQSWRATDVDERMWVFRENIQVFNEVYKSKIEEAIENLDPNNTESIENLQKAIKDYQEIFDSDMKDFFNGLRDQIKRELEVKKEKWWNIDGYQVYDRNNFEHVAKRFQKDTEIYTEALLKLEQSGQLTQQAFELRQQLKKQYKELLENSQEILWHFIDSDNIKSELKWPLWREIYAKLISIRSRFTNWEIINFDEEFWKNSNKIKELLWIENEWSEETIKNAIDKIEKSWLSDYYSIIGLVHNPQIERILTEDAVYWSREKWYYLTQENWYVTESDNSYKERMDHDKIFEEQLKKWEKDIWDIKWHLRWLIETNEVIDDTSKTQINNLVSYMITEYSDLFPSKVEAYKFFKATTEALIFQTMESDTRSMWDHGINHISWNIARLNNYLEAEAKEENWTEWDKKIWQFMWCVGQIFHDKWYSALISTWANHRKGSDLHPFTSKTYFDEIIKPLLPNTINTTLISQAIESHDGIEQDSSSPENRFLSWFNVSDNMALWLDKVPLLQRNPILSRNRAILYKMGQLWFDLQWKWWPIERIINIINKSNLSSSEKEAAKSAVTELSRRSFENLDFLSIDPYWDAEIKDWIRIINMYKADTFALAAESNWINSELLNTIIEKAKETWDTTELEKLIKNEKFWNQITKPLKDYQNKYILANQNWEEYPKKKNKKWKFEYDWNKISADLLIWKTILIQEWTKAENNTEFVKSNWTTIRWYVFKENSEIPQQGKEGWFRLNKELEKQIKDWIEHRNNLKIDQILKEVSELDESIKTIKEKIEKWQNIKEDEIRSFEDLITNLETLEVSNDANFNKQLDKIKESSTEIINDLKNNNINIKDKLNKLQQQINGSLATLII